MTNHLEIHPELEAVAKRWRDQRADRLTRRHLDRADFDELAAVGFQRAAVPTGFGGRFEGAAASTRPMCEALRTLARGDPSVALVSAMHPAVVGFWLNTPAAGEPAWDAQRTAVFDSVLGGKQWGTITSEPGSGGDITQTKTRAEPDDAIDIGLPGRGCRLSGQKHFGSGSGIADFMITTAVMAGEDEPSMFAMDTTDHAWDGSAGMMLLAEWDGMGMKATQSHAMALDGAPAVRLAFDGPIQTLAVNNAPFVSCLFTSVILGVLDEAVATAKAVVGPRIDGLRAYERVEWTRAEAGYWLAVQAYEGGLRAVESGDVATAVHGSLRAKQTSAELAEEVMLRLTRVVGGGTFSQRSPFAHWFEDVRALGFLRPPWALAYDMLLDTSTWEPNPDA
ncbi:MAG: hypothetical protein ACXW1S_10645 [Acidimicrobiia bacterium]